MIRLVLSIFVCTTLSASAAFNARLQGQSRGSTTWIDGNLKGWRDLDSVLCRVYLTGGPVNNKTIVVEFDHAQGRNPAINNLCQFTPSPNVRITSMPVLSAPVNSWRWSYTFTVSVLDNKPGWVLYNAKLAAGAHLNGGSSVAMRGSPSLGTLQIHKIAAAATPATVDLALTKLGAGQAAPGEVITYTLQYSNKITSTAQATGVQISDVLPAQVTPILESLGSGQFVVNSVTWNLGNLNAGSTGTLTYSVRVSTNAAFGQAFTNLASISSSQPDANPADNNASVTTRIVFNRPPVANSDTYQTQQNQTLIILQPGVLANDTDADGNPLAAVLVNGPAHGSVILNPDGSFTYTPSTNYAGLDSFTYKANDGLTDSSAVAVSINILLQPRNEPPVAVNDLYGTPTNSVLIVPAAGVLVNDSDADNDTLTALLLEAPAHGALTLNPNGSFQYLPVSGFAGVDTFTYKARDGFADSLPAIVTIIVSRGSGTNTPPNEPEMFPPVVTLRSPTNGAVYIEGMDIQLIADASDIDGTITNVNFLGGEILLGSDTEADYTLLLTNVPSGQYIFSATATDNDGATAVSAPVAVTVLPNAPYAAGPFRLNRQTGLFEQLVTISNPTPQSFPRMRLWIMDVRRAVTVWNATGQVSGVPYIDILAPVPAGGSVQVLVEYYTPDVRISPEPQFLPEVL